MDQATLFDNLIIVKRSGQRTNFQGEKIAIAIQKAFESVDIPYKDEDVNKVYEKVLVEIAKKYQDRKTINIENIQDIIEEVLKRQKFQDVYVAFSTYRNQRNASRKTFVIKQQHKFLKAIESLGLSNITEDNLTPQRLLEKFGSTISLEFAKAYLLDNKITRAHDSGLIYLHSIETMPMGSIDNLEIDLVALEQLDTEVATLLRKQESVEAYLAEVTKLILNEAKEQYGDIAFIHFDDDLMNITKRHFLSIFFGKISLYLQLEGLEQYISIETIRDNIFSISDINDILNKLQDVFCGKKRNLDLEIIYQMSIQEIRSVLFKGLQSFCSSLVSIHVSFNFGTNISFLGKIINAAIIDTINMNRRNISYFFKVKSGISYKTSDEGFDLLEYYINCIKNNSCCYFSFLDSKFNKLDGEEICYFSKGQRVVDDNTTLDKKNVGGKGNLATVSINLVRAALKSKVNSEIDQRLFYQNLEQMLSLARDGLLARFELQCNKSIQNFIHLFKDGLWHDGEKLRDTDRLRKLLKHGSLTIHFCGLKEVITLLEPNADIQKTKQLAFDIVKFIRKRLDQFSEDYNLNFVLSATSYEFVATEFKKQDTAIFGKIKGVTDKDSYSRGDDIDLPIEEVGKFQSYLNSGHLLECSSKNILEQIKIAKENNIGCIRITK